MFKMFAKAYNEILFEYRTQTFQYTVGTDNTHVSMYKYT